jgi:outer membrane receptor for ferrienterochelin and colicins
MSPCRLMRLLSVSSLAAIAVPASAQMIDYDALQQTMGEPVTTSVTGKPQRQSETSASTTIITRDEILHSPARDLPGLLKTYAGIDVNRWTAGQSDVAVRGGVQTYNARLLVLVDGRQVYLDHYGLTDWNLIGVQLEEIQQIELVRGPTSALFGFNAASGVVNIITRKVRDTAAATFSASGGNHGFSRAAGSLTMPLSEAVGAKLTAGRLREGERKIPAYLLRPTSVYDVATDQVSGQLDSDFGSTAATIGGGYSTNRQIEYLPSQLLSNQRYRSGSINSTLAQDTGWGGISVNGYVNWLDVSYAVQGTDNAPLPSVEIKNRIAAIKSSGLYRLDSDKTVRLGVEYRNTRLHGNSQFADTIAYDVLAGEAMFDIHMNDNVLLTAATRVDKLMLHASGQLMQPAFNDIAHFNRDFSRLSFNVALLVKNGERGQLRINGGLGYQLPSLENYGLRVRAVTPTAVPLFVAGTPQIRPVRIWSAEAGYTYDLDAVRIEATGFYNRTEGVIASPGDGIESRAELFFVPTPVVVVRFASAGDYETYGAEISAGGTVSGLKWRANYTWTHTAGDLTGTSLPIQLAISPRQTTPEHKANLTLGYDAPRWYVSGVARYVSATRQFAFSTAPQLLLFKVQDSLALDTRVGFRVTPGLELFAAGENLSSASGAAGSPIPADRRIRGGVRFNL